MIYEFLFGAVVLVGLILAVILFFYLLRKNDQNKGGK